MPMVNQVNDVATTGDEGLNDEVCTSICTCLSLTHSEGCKCSKHDGGRGRFRAKADDGERLTTVTNAS